MKRKVSGKAMAIPVGIAAGTVLSLLISVAGAAVCAWLVASEKIGEGGIGYAAIGIAALSAVMGAWFSSSAVKRLRLQTCLLTGGCYFLSLLAVTALFFGGEYERIGLTGAVILVGCAAVALLSVKQKQFKGRAKKAYR